MTDSIFTLPPARVQTRWASPENSSARPGNAGRVNGGRKGAPNLPLNAGSSVTLAEEASGVSGTIRRIWITIPDRSPAMLRGVRVDFYWDGARTPAVSAPLGDFFGVGLGRMVAFESEYFSNPEARSFNCVAPMPFRDGMRLVITNETDVEIPWLFYDVDYTVGDLHGPEMLYFHAHWRRENPTTLQQDYALLPTVEGAGRFLGVNIGVVADTAKYQRTWWGEGEVKFYLDGDSDRPTLCGTGTEDYIGTAWGQGAYSHRYQGCPVADAATSSYCFYRYHVTDPVYFWESIRVTIQQIGHAFGERALALVNGETPIYRAGPGLNRVGASDIPESGVLFERADDWSSCAYFYLNRPENGLPALAPLAERTAGLTYAAGLTTS